MAIRQYVPAVLLCALIAAMCQAQQPKVAKKVVPAAKTPVRDAAAEEEIFKALETNLKLEVKELPLGDLVEFLRDALKIPIVIDQRALEDVGIDSGTRITFTMSGISARSSLELILTQLDLTWAIRNEVLLITTPEEAESVLITRVYDVSDLVLVRDEKNESFPDFDNLISLITSSITPESWIDGGGAGSIDGFEAAGLNALVVSQTLEVHDRLDKLLTSLRKIQQDNAPLPKIRPIQPPHPNNPWANPFMMGGGMGMGGGGMGGMGGGGMGMGGGGFGGAGGGDPNQGGGIPNPGDGAVDPFNP